MSNQLKVDFVDGSSDVVTIDSEFEDCFIAKNGVVLILCSDRIINMNNVKFIQKWSDEKQALYVKNLVGSMYRYQKEAECVKNLVGGMYGYYAPVEEA